MAVKGSHFELYWTREPEPPSQASLQLNYCGVGFPFCDRSTRVTRRKSCPLCRDCVEETQGKSLHSCSNSGAGLDPEPNAIRRDIDHLRSCCTKTVFSTRPSPPNPTKNVGDDATVLTTCLPHVICNITYGFKLNPTYRASVSVQRKDNNNFPKWNNPLGGKRREATGNRLRTLKPRGPHTFGNPSSFRPDAVWFFRNGNGHRLRTVFMNFCAIRQYGLSYDNLGDHDHDDDQHGFCSPAAESEP